MTTVKTICTFFLLFIATNIFAQRVHYKDNYYTLVNSKIFHLGHNVYGKLTQGERDTLYMIARELYDENGKLKPKYKQRRKRDRYKLPEGFWESKTDSTAVKEITLMVNSVQDDSSASNENEPDESLSRTAKEKEDGVAIKREDKNERAQKKKEKAERKQTKKTKKKEKKAEKKEKDLKQKEKAIDRFDKAEKNLKKAEKKYIKLKEKGELSPNDEAEWLKKIEKLKAKREKTKKKVKKA